MNYLAEQWRPVVGYEGFYDISSIGRVRRSWESHSSTAGRLLVLSIGQHGYRCVSLCTNGKPVKRTVHALVAAAFIGPRPVGFHTNHIDSDKLNNDLSNLEYITHGANLRHAAEHGFMCRGSSVPAAKLTETQVAEIKLLRDQLYRREIAAIYGVAKTTIDRIFDRKNWKHVA